MAGHVAAMAPGTSIGAAHPVGIGGGDQAPREDEEGGGLRDFAAEKAENFTASFIESIAKERGRNAEWAVEAVRRGVALVPEMRHSQGLFFNLPISENLLLAREAVSTRWRRVAGAERRECEALLQRWGIKAASIDVPPGSLSGGNQQKVVLARWLLTEPRVLLLDEPTKGVDIGAKHDIHRLIREEAAKGMACLVVSSDLPELLAVADRIVVMKEGRVQGEVAAGASEADVMHLATTSHEVSAA